jgi:hypothetical protein
MMFRRLVNAVLRRRPPEERRGLAKPKVVVRPHHFGFKPGIDMDKLNQLADELEAEAFTAKYRR